MIKMNTNALNIKSDDGSWKPITLNGAGSNIDIDTSLSEDSTNAIANNAVTMALSNKISADDFATDEDINNLYKKEGT